MNIQVDPTRSNLASGMLNSKISPRAVVGYGVKICLPSPPSYVTRSRGNWWFHVFVFLSKKCTKMRAARAARAARLFSRLLRTVPTIVIAHTFCASRDTRISYCWCLLIQGYFCAVQNYAEKAELSKWSWYPKRKLGVTTHFSEIIEFQIWKRTPYIALYFKTFYKYCWLIIFEKCVVTLNFLFGFSITLVKIFFSRIFSKTRKNNFELVGTVLNQRYSCFLTMPLPQPSSFFGVLTI